MKRAGFFALAGWLVVAAAIPAMAAEGDPIQGYIAGGYTDPLGRAGDVLTGGWNFSGGVLWHPSPAEPFGVRLDLGFNTWNATQSAINNYQGTGAAFVDGGYANMWTLTGDALWQFGHPGHVGGFIGLGIGGYRRYAALTDYVTQIGTICDPWWGYCYYAPYTGSQTVAHDTLTKFGYNAAVGVSFPLGPGAMYFEARYHWVNNSPAMEFIPVLIGYRF
jgi:hypothetical protein